LATVAYARPLIFGKKIPKGALPLFVDALKLHARVEATVLRAIKALRNLAADAFSVRAMLDSGVLPLVASAMVAHRALPTQIACCELLLVMTVASSDTDGDAAAAAAKLNVQGVLAAAAGNGDSYVLLRVVLRVLWHVATNERNRDQIIVKGGIPLVLSALATHGGDDEVQLCATATLALLATGADGRRGIMVDAAMPLVLRAISEHPQHHGVQLHACACVRWLTEDARSRGVAANAGAVGVLRDAIDRAPADDADLCSHAMIALGACVCVCLCVCGASEAAAPAVRLTILTRRALRVRRKHRA
jgi:hypothetical protein